MFHIFLRSPENVQEYPVVSFTNQQEIVDYLMSHNMFYEGSECDETEDCVYFFFSDEAGVTYTVVVDGGDCREYAPAMPDNKWAALEYVEETFDEIFRSVLYNQDDIDDEPPFTVDEVSELDEMKMTKKDSPSLPGRPNWMICNIVPRTFYTVAKEDWNILALLKEEGSLIEKDIPSSCTYIVYKDQVALTGMYDFHEVQKMIKGCNAVFSGCYRNATFAFAYEGSKLFNDFEIEADDLVSEVIMASFAKSIHEDELKFDPLNITICDTWSKACYMNLLSYYPSVNPENGSAYSVVLQNLFSICDKIVSGELRWHKQVVDPVDKTKVSFIFTSTTYGGYRKIISDSLPITHHLITTIAEVQLETRREEALAVLKPMALRSLQSIFALGLPDEHTQGVVTSVSKAVPYVAPTPKLSASDMAGLRPKPQSPEEIENKRVEAQDKLMSKMQELSEAAKRKTEQLAVFPDCYPRRGGCEVDFPLKYSSQRTMPRWNFVIDRDTNEFVRCIVTTSYGSFARLSTDRQVYGVTFTQLSKWKNPELYGNMPDESCTTNSGITIHQNAKHRFVSVAFIDDLPECWSEIIIKNIDNVKPERLNWDYTNEVWTEADAELTYQVANSEKGSYNANGEFMPNGYATGAVVAKTFKSRAECDPAPNAPPSYISSFLNYAKGLVTQ